MLTYSLPTTTKDTYDYHLIKGEAEETMMPTIRMPTVAPVRANCTGVTHSHLWDRLSQQADLALHRHDRETGRERPQRHQHQGRTREKGEPRHRQDHEAGQETRLRHQPQGRTREE